MPSLWTEPRFTAGPLEGETLKDNTVRKRKQETLPIPNDVLLLLRAMYACCKTEAVLCGSFDMDIEPDDIEVSDTVTVIWEIE